MFARLFWCHRQSLTPIVHNVVQFTREHMPFGNPTPTNANVDSVSSMDVLMVSATVDTGFQMMIALLVGTQWGKSSIARHVAQCLVPYLAAALFTLVLWMLEFVIGFFEDGVGWWRRFPYIIMIQMKNKSLFADC